MSATTADSGRRWALHNGLHLLVLWSFAVVQPTLEVLKGSPEFFIARRIDGLSFLIGLGLFVLLVPSLIVAIEGLAARAGTIWRQRVHLLAVWVLLTLIVLYVLERLAPNATYVIILGSVLVGAITAWSYARWPAMQALLTFLAPAPLVFLVAFLFFSPANGLVFPEDPPSAGGAASEAPVVMVIFDELPVSSLMNERGRIDARRYPNFARLARGSNWFRNTTTSADLSSEAIPALLTGRVPGEDLIAVAGDYPSSLFTLLGGNHEVVAMEHESSLCPPSLCPPERSVVERVRALGSALSLLYARIVVPDDLVTRLPALGSTWGEILRARDPSHRPDPDVASAAELKRYGDAEFEAFLRRISPQAPGQAPPFYFLHSSLPHEPWVFEPSGRVHTSYFDDQPGLINNTLDWAPDQRLADQGHQRQLLQVAYVDKLLGQLIERLKGAGLYDRSLLVVTSDHGNSFRAPGPRRAAQASNIGDVGLVPLLVKEPGQPRGRTLDKSIQTVDLLPTIIDLLDLQTIWEFDGQSAFELPPRGRREVVVSRGFGGEVRLPVRDLLQQRRDTVRRQVRLFGAGGFGPRFFSLGDHSELIGRQPADLPQGDVDSVEARLTDAGDYESVDLDARYVPAVVRGAIEGALPPDASPEVAIAVNGRIEAVGPIYSTAGQLRFSILIPEQSLRHGGNLIEVLSIREYKNEIALGSFGG